MVFQFINSFIISHSISSISRFLAFLFSILLKPPFIRDDPIFIFIFAVAPSANFKTFWYHHLRLNSLESKDIIPTLVIVKILLLYGFRGVFIFFCLVSFIQSLIYMFVWNFSLDQCKTIFKLCISLFSLLPYNPISLPCFYITRLLVVNLIYFLLGNEHSVLPHFQSSCTYTVVSLAIYAAIKRHVYNFPVIHFQLRQKTKEKYFKIFVH